jgi:hypothetical protein
MQWVDLSTLLLPTNINADGTMSSLRLVYCPQESVPCVHTLNITAVDATGIMDVFPLEVWENFTKNILAFEVSSSVDGWTGVEEVKEIRVPCRSLEDKNPDLRPTLHIRRKESISSTAETAVFWACLVKHSLAAWKGVVAKGDNNPEDKTRENKKIPITEKEVYLGSSYICCKVHVSKIILIGMMCFSEQVAGMKVVQVT